MYLIINNERYTVSRRLVSADEIKYLSVEPQPDIVTGKIRMYTNEGALMSEDNADDFFRYTYTGTLLVLTNAPVPVPPAEPDEPVEYPPTTDEVLNTLLGVSNYE